MPKKSDKLESWYNMVKGPVNLTIDEAKNLYLEIQKEKNELRKKELKNELVLGTIHVLYNQLKNSYLGYFQVCGVDIEDVIQSGFELWMKYILEGEFFNAPYYSFYFNHTFFYRLNRELYGNNFSFSEFFKIQKNKILEMLEQYVLLRNERYTFSYEEFCEKFPKSSYALFEFVYRKLESAQLLDIDFSSRQLLFLFPSIVQEYMNGVYNPKDWDGKTLRVEGQDCINEVEKNMLSAQFLEIFEKSKYPSERDKKILAEFHGLSFETNEEGHYVYYDIFPKSFKQIIREYCVVSSRVYEILDSSYASIKYRSRYKTNLENIHEELVRARSRER